LYKKLKKVYDVEHLGNYDESTQFIVKTLYANGIKEAELVRGVSALYDLWSKLEGTISVYVIVDKDFNTCDEGVPGRIYLKAADKQWVTVLAGTPEDHGTVLVDNSRVKWGTIRHLAQLKDTPILFVVE